MTFLQTEYKRIEERLAERIRSSRELIQRSNEVGDRYRELCYQLDKLKDKT
jgi:hypothetical protein